MVASISAFSLRRSGVRTNCLSSLEKQFEPDPFSLFQQKQRRCSTTSLRATRVPSSSKYSMPSANWWHHPCRRKSGLSGLSAAMKSRRKIDWHKGVCVRAKTIRLRYLLLRDAYLRVAIQLRGEHNMSEWTTRYCDDCGSEMHVHEDWDNPPKICKSCREDRAAQWYERSCSDCGTTIKIHTDWENPPTLCLRCKQKHAAKWYERSCADCGTTIKIHMDWENPPSLCDHCKQKRAAQWYEKSCEKCGTAIKVHRDWDNTPKYCAPCKEKMAAKWYDVKCQGCGSTIKANRDWENPPTYCSDCKDSNPTRDINCSHCGERFAIKPGTQIQCKKNGWELPKKCPACRELFKHKPFKTVKEKTAVLGHIIYRTYNGIGQLISETRDERTPFLGIEQRRHTSKSGETVGITRDKKTAFLGKPYRETKRPDGSVKSTSTEKKTPFLGHKYTESKGGSSNTTHKTTTETTWTGKKYRKTE